MEYNIRPGPNVIKVYISVIYKFLYKDKMYVLGLGRPFQPNLMWSG